MLKGLFAAMCLNVFKNMQLDQERLSITDIFLAQIYHICIQITRSSAKKPKVKPCQGNPPLDCHPTGQLPFMKFITVRIT